MNHFKPGLFEFLADLKRKDFVCSVNTTQKAACRAGFFDRFERTCRDSAPFARFLTEAVGLGF